MMSTTEYESKDVTDRLTALEIRVAYQENTITALDEVIQEQFALIDRLKREVEQLRTQLESQPASAKVGSLEDELPPHY